MSKNYRRLNSKDEEKLKFYGKLKFYLKKGTKGMMSAFAILLLLAVGLVAFYKILDESGGQKASGLAQETISCKSENSSDDTQGFSELEKKELERESEKESKISEFRLPEDDSKEIKFHDFSVWNSYCSPELIVVNDANMLSSGFEAKTKVCRGKEVGEVMADDLEQMIVDAKKEGIILWISSGYRSVELQTTLFNRQVEREKSKSKEMISQEEAEKRAAKVVARPNSSEHNTGLAIDFNGVCDNFYTTKEYKWLMDNAHKYGFIERYQKEWKEYTGVIYEPWHFRYVGKEVAPLIKESGLCLEEYVRNKLIDKALEGNL